MVWPLVVINTGNVTSEDSWSNRDTLFTNRNFFDSAGVTAASAGNGAGYIGQSWDRD